MAESSTKMERLLFLNPNRYLPALFGPFPITEVAIRRIMQVKPENRQTSEITSGGGKFKFLLILLLLLHTSNAVAQSCCDSFDAYLCEQDGGRYNYLNCTCRNTTTNSSGFGREWHSPY